MPKCWPYWNVIVAITMSCLLIISNSKNIVLYNAPINVNPKRGGGGSGKGPDLINQFDPWVGIWTDTFCPRVGIFDRLTLISDDILKKPEPIFEYFELKTGHQFIARRLAYCFYKKYVDFWTRMFDSHRGQAYFQACPVWIHTQSNITSNL